MKFFKMFGAGLVALAAVSGTAFGQDATYPYVDVKSDVGSYDPVALGENIQLDGCGTKIWAASGTPTFSWCDITNYSEFSLSWQVWSWDTWSWTTFASYSDNDVGAGLTAVINTGLGTPFTSAGVYYIGLLAEVTSSQYHLGKDVSITLPGGLIRYPGGDSALSYDGSTNKGFDYTALVINEATSVPEPLGALLLLPGLIFMARRERRRRRA